MSDFDTLVRDALHRGAQEAPPAKGLAASARARHRTRRRTTMGLGAAAATLVVAAPVGAVLLHQEDAPVADRGTDRPVALADGWRTEQLGDVRVAVPGDWVKAGSTDWCANEGDLLPGRVSGPDQAVFDVRCTPTHGYGVSATPDAQLRWVYPPGTVWQYQGGDEYPEDAWLGYQKVGSTDIVVVTPERATTQRVVDSARR